MIDIEIEKPNITPCDKNESGSIGEFVVEPLERGYGITLGNSLRRILLGSLAGYAATSIKIDGVLHEISTVDGVKEDVPEIVLNVKGIIAKLHTAGPKTVIIDNVGPCTVTAGDSWESISGCLFTMSYIQSSSTEREEPRPRMVTDMVLVPMIWNCSVM